MDTDATVLIVEADVAIARDLWMTLDRVGYRVIGLAPHFEVALAMAERHRPAVAIVDLELPTSIDGVSVGYELIRQYGTRVIFLTARPERLATEALLNPGNVIPKPLATGELLHAMEHPRPATFESMPV